MYTVSPTYWYNCLISVTVTAACQDKQFKVQCHKNTARSMAVTKIYASNQTQATCRAVNFEKCIKLNMHFLSTVHPCLACTKAADALCRLCLLEEQLSRAAQHDPCLKSTAWKLKQSESQALPHEMPDMPCYAFAVAMRPIMCSLAIFNLSSMQKTYLLPMFIKLTCLCSLALHWPCDMLHIHFNLHPMSPLVQWYHHLAFGSRN